MTRHLLVIAISISIAGCMGGRSNGSTASSPPEASPSDREARASAGAEEPAERAESGAEPAAESAEDAEPAQPAEVSSQDRELVQSLAGEWRLAESDAEAQIDRAIAEVTGQMNFFARGIANGRIDEAVNPDDRVSIEADGDHVVVGIGEARPTRLALNGPFVDGTGADGQPLRTRAILRGERLSIEERTEQGTRILTFQPRGDALVMTTRIRSEQLPDDIVYGLRYRQAGGGEVASR